MGPKRGAKKGIFGLWKWDFPVFLILGSVEGGEGSKVSCVCILKTLRRRDTKGKRPIRFRGLRAKAQLVELRFWEVVPDILICTARAAAQGLQPCTSEDEATWRMRITYRELHLSLFITLNPLKVFCGSFFVHELVAVILLQVPFICIKLQYSAVLWRNLLSVCHQFGSSVISCVICPLLWDIWFYFTSNPPPIFLNLFVLSLYLSLPPLSLPPSLSTLVYISRACALGILCVSISDYVACVRLPTGACVCVCLHAHQCVLCATWFCVAVCEYIYICIFREEKGTQTQTFWSGYFPVG